MDLFNKDILNLVCKFADVRAEYKTDRGIIKVNFYNKCTRCHGSIKKKYKKKYVLHKKCIMIQKCEQSNLELLELIKFSEDEIVKIYDVINMGHNHNILILFAAMCVKKKKEYNNEIDKNLKQINKYI